MTYTIYSSPNDISGTGYELAFAGSCRGDNLLGGLSPQLKIAKPTDRGGVYSELVATPGLSLFQASDWPLSSACRSRLASASTTTTARAPTPPPSSGSA